MEVISYLFRCLVQVNCLSNDNIFYLTTYSKYHFEWYFIKVDLYKMKNSDVLFNILIELIYMLNELSMDVMDILLLQHARPYTS